MARESKQIEAFRAEARKCPLPSAIDLVGERWAFLILRGALNGLQHFEEFQACLGIARNILSDRLAKMVTGGILLRAADPSDRRRVIYSLTAKGEVSIFSTFLYFRETGPLVPLKSAVVLGRSRSA